MCYEGVVREQFNDANDNFGDVVMRKLVNITVMISERL